MSLYHGDIEIIFLIVYDFFFFLEKSQCSSEEKSMPKISDISTDFIFWLVISSVSALMFTLGYYYLENRKQDGKLLAMVNTLQKELLCSSKVCRAYIFKISSCFFLNSNHSYILRNAFC